MLRRLDAEERFLQLVCATANFISVMKCHSKMFPHTSAYPVPRPDTRPAKSSKRERPNFSTNELRQPLPQSAIRGETAESPLLYVVDDEARLIDLYTIILEANGYAVRAFNNRFEALAELKGAMQKPDLLIMDYLGHAMSVDGFMQR
jgi:PleD family two-component response regulator